MIKKILVFLIVAVSFFSVTAQSHYNSTKCTSYSYNCSSHDYQFYEACDLQTSFIINENDSSIDVLTLTSKNTYCIAGKEINYEENEILYAVIFNSEFKYVITFDLKESTIKISSKSYLHAPILIYNISKFWEE